MREIHVYVASSVQEFERERMALDALFFELNNVLEQTNVRIVWNRCGDWVHFPAEGVQYSISQVISESDVFIFFASNRIGAFILAEFQAALECLKKTGKPQIFPCLLLSDGVMPSPDVIAFQNLLREQGQHCQIYSSSAEMQTDIQWYLLLILLNIAAPNPNALLELKDYYKQNHTVESSAECKVIFLGDGAAGKSSLIERIVHDKFKDGSLPTDGVKMTKWTRWSNGKLLTLEDGTPLTIRFLDFGGQEIMHSMHRCFLTVHTVYVVVCESRDDGELARVAARWMETVRSFAPDCPVILALNKSDLNPNVAVNERTLKALNPAYRHTIHTSAKRDGDLGVRQLTESILREVPTCLRQMSGNRGVLELKRELENMEEDYILPERFRQRCAHFQISESFQEELLNWFQDLGVAYAYIATVQRFYVLNPAWLTNGIYRLILRTPNGGFLCHSDILSTLEQSYSGDVSDKTYTTQEMEFILHIMRKFEISMRVTPDYEADGVEMIPMKMTMTPPNRYDDFPKDGALHLRWEAGYLPNNLAHRLIIRKYAELDPERKPREKCVWRTGGWFRSTDGGCQALVEMTEKALDVYVQGERDARVYMDSFRQQILQILGDLNIIAEEYVYCTFHGKTGRILYQHVMARRRKDKKEIYLGDIDEDVPVDWILQENYVNKVESEHVVCVVGNYYQGGSHMTNTNNFNGNVGQANTVEGSGNTFNQNGVDLAALADAIRKQTSALDPKKLVSLKKELLALSKVEDMPMTARLKMRSLLKALEAVDGNGQTLWDALKPFVGDADSLTKTAALFGTYGGKFLEILRKFAFPV